MARLTATGHAATAARLYRLPGGAGFDRLAVTAMILGTSGNDVLRAATTR